MKKMLILFFSFLLLGIFSFSCMGEGVYPDVIDSREHDDINEETLIDPDIESPPLNPSVIPRYTYYSTYEAFLENHTIPEEHFMPWENFSSLGKLKHVRCYHSGLSYEHYGYVFCDENDVDVSIACYAYADLGSDKIGIEVDPSSYSGSVFLGSSEIFENSDRSTSAIINGASYCYAKNGRLIKIQLPYATFAGNVFFCVLSLVGNHSALEDYPLSEKQTLITRLLYLETAPDAIDELRARLNGTYVEPWVLPTAICGGAVVLAAAVAIPIVIIRRKKRKMAADAATAEAEGV